MKCAKIHPIFNDIRFFPFNGILFLIEFNFDEIWDYSWFCSSDSTIELCVGVLYFKVLIGRFLCKEAVRWKKEELQQVLNERSRKCNRTRSRQAILTLFYLSKHWGAWPCERPSPGWRSSWSSEQRHYCCFYFFVLFVYKKTWLWSSAIIILRNTEGSQVCPPQRNPVVFEIWLAAWPSEVVLGPSPTECAQAGSALGTAGELWGWARGRNGLGDAQPEEDRCRARTESLAYFHSSFTEIVCVSWRSGLCAWVIAWGGWKDF